MNGQEHVLGISRTDIITFGELTGNNHEIHVTDEAAEAAGFPAQVVQGPFLLARAISTSSEVLRGPGIALLGVTWRYTGAVVRDQPMELHWEITGVRRTSAGNRGVAELTMRLESDGQRIGEGGFTVLVTEEFVDEFAQRPT